MSACILGVEVTESSTHKQHTLSLCLAWILLNNTYSLSGLLPRIHTGPGRKGRAKSSREEEEATCITAKLHVPQTRLRSTASSGKGSRKRTRPTKLPSYQTPPLSQQLLLPLPPPPPPPPPPHPFLPIQLSLPLRQVLSPAMAMAGVKVFFFSTFYTGNSNGGGPGTFSMYPSLGTGYSCVP